MKNASIINEEKSTVHSSKYICIGILAHVDAGKTTLSESILYQTGSLRKLGRVDHKDTFLDTHELERDRGITIFSKQAVLDLGDVKVTLLDTPGHVDFSAEMERTLQVLDYAILVINGADGVQGHTRTLWKLLGQYRIPTFLFVNKMDQEETDQAKLLSELKAKLDEGCISFNEMGQETFYEELATCDEAALEEYLESGKLSEDTLTDLIRQRRIYPCYFGSALKIQGIDVFLEGLKTYASMGYMAAEDGPFGARVYKISRDGQGNRLTHLKITSGTLEVKGTVEGEADGEVWEEKVNQIRIYSGDKYEMAQRAVPGMICAVTGLTHTYPGQGIGREPLSDLPQLLPVLNYEICLPEGCDVHVMLRGLRQLEEEDPMLQIVWNEELGELHARLMGEVQTEILGQLIEDRFGVKVTFGAGNIVYKETIQTRVEGVGHFEPLRHYAEVHLILEPGKPGSGMKYKTDCSEDLLDRNWQRLILTHLAERAHRGVLTGSEITDMKVTLVSGKAHLKHTEGGDFRQATYRAVRQGLMQAESVLLEPYYDFRLEVPAEMVGRAMTDIQRMSGECSPPRTEGEMAVLTGSVPASEVRDYQKEVIGYTRGRGQLSCSFRGYAPCHNPEEIIAASGYDPDRDLDNPTGSVFCSHGAGVNIPWDKVPEHMHLESRLAKERKEQERLAQAAKRARRTSDRNRSKSAYDKKEEQELEEIFIRTYGKIERRVDTGRRAVEAAEQPKAKKKVEGFREYLLVDGYNVIFAWEELKELARDNIEAARNKLMDILSNYQGFKQCTVILVFDAYKVDGYALEIQKYHNIHVVYTKEAETADQYIEKVVHEIGRKYHVTVVTSDGVEQVVTLGLGGTLISSREFREEVETVSIQIREEAESRRESSKNYLFDHMDEKLAEEMEAVRLGKKAEPSFPI